MTRYSMTNGNKKLILTESKMANSLHEDTGFCSGEDYMEHEIHSPTDSSEDSVEVKVSAIPVKHKRKATNETKKETVFSGPLKKRMCLKVKAETNEAISAPFRPWSLQESPAKHVPIGASKFAVPFPLKTETQNQHAEPPKPVSSFSYFRPPSPVNFAQEPEPVALVIKREPEDKLSTKPSDMRVPVHPEISSLSTAETERVIFKSKEQFPGLQGNEIGTPEAASSLNQDQRKAESKREQRNYKNMTRERRIEANARERTRVHTISAAFDTLRRAIPSYSHNQKLSKLSVLRIACSYIMTLSSLVDSDNEEQPTAECVDMVSRTIQREGKLRKKKDDND